MGRKRTPWPVAMALLALSAACLTECDRGVIDLLAERVTLDDGGAGGRPALPTPNTHDADSRDAAPPPAEAASGCTSGADCAEPTPVCDTESGRCIECRCPASLTCDADTGQCIPGLVCGPQGECPFIYPRCDPTRSVCVQCITDAECLELPFFGPRCFDGICGECSSDAECPFDQPHCDPFLHFCACFDDRDCPMGSFCTRDGRCR